MAPSENVSTSFSDGAGVYVTYKACSHVGEGVYNTAYVCSHIEAFSVPLRENDPLLAPAVDADL